METLPIAGWILGGGLTVVGLVISWVVWRRRGAAAGLRGMAWSLLPLAAGLVGLMATVWRIGFILVTDITRFFVGLVFNPVVWAGVVVAALAVVLWVVSGVMRTRGVGTGGSPKTKEATAGGAAEVPSGGQSGTRDSSAAKGKSGADDDFGEIEDLLRKHGIE